MRYGNCVFNAAGIRIGILYAFDPQRNALLILGGDKTGNDRWYEENVPRAERIYGQEQYLKEIEEESK